MSDTDTLLSTSLGAVLKPTEAAELVKNCQKRTLDAGKTLFVAGDKGDALYIVLSGNLDVVLGKLGPGQTIVATLGAGRIVGELEVMTRSLRVASVVARDTAELFELGLTKLEAMQEANNPAASRLVATIAKTLARRLAAVNQRITERAPTPAPTPAATPTPAMAKPAAAPVPAAPALAAAGVPRAGGVPCPRPGPGSAPRPPSGPIPVAAPVAAAAPAIAASPVARGGLEDTELDVLDKLWS